MNDTIPFPKPPKEKQDEIANHITAIRKQAQDLKDLIFGVRKKLVKRNSTWRIANC